MGLAQGINPGLEVLVFCSFVTPGDSSCASAGNTNTPWGSSVISSGDTCPSRSFVACTLELNPLASLFADWPKLRLAMPDCSDFHPEAMVVMSS